LKRLLPISLVSLLFLTAYLGCTTQKSRHDLTPLGKAYHNTTARYNGYYNATVLLEESYLQLNEQHQDNYNKLLPVFPYRVAPNPKAAASALDQAIEKVSIVVAMHRQSQWTDDCYLLIGQAQYLKQDFEAAEETLEYLASEYSPQAIRDRESKSKSAQNKKKAAAQKQKEREVKKKEAAKKKKEAEKARKKAIKEKRKEIARKKKQRNSKKRKPSSGSTPRTPRVTPNPEEETNTLNPEEKPESKEDLVPRDTGRAMISIGSLKPSLEETKPESYLVKHRPAHQVGLLWLARTYIERGNYKDAQRLISELDRNPGTFKDVRRELAKVEAYLFIQQKQYAAAIEPLERAISLDKDRDNKARYAFIIAQIYQQLGRGDAAYAGYERVVKLKPNYEMTFNAKLNMAQNAWRGGRASVADVKRDLERMTKDIKNAEYLDQVYYTIALIDIEQGDKQSAIASLEKSLETPSSNTTTKIEVNYLLATIYFEEENFVKAKEYFDGTLAVMPKTDERYNLVSQYARSLTDIALNLNTITLKDSLIRISMLSEEEQRALAISMKRKKEEERLAAILKQRENQANPASKFGTPSAAMAGGPALANSRAGQEPSTFFAYDDRAVKRGERDFERRWGTRPLQDNWRRSSALTGSGTEELAAAKEAFNPASVTEEEIQALLKDVPKNESELEHAKKAIMDALFALGGLYRDRLNNNVKAVQAHEELLSRFPETQYQLDALYSLYLASGDIPDAPKAKYYYDKIVNEHPNSNYARALLDPNYLAKTMDANKRVNDYYDECYLDFTSGRYAAAAEKIEQAPKKFGSTNKLQPRFALLGAMCKAQLEGEEAYVEGLKEVIARHPKTPEELRAREILRLLGALTATGPGGVAMNAAQDESPYTYQEDDIQLIIIVFDNNVNLNDAKNGTSDFNTKYFKSDRLRLSNIYLGEADSRTPIIVVRKFDNIKGARSYLQTIELNPKDFLPGIQNRVMIITQNNYRELLKSRDVNSYIPFFELNY
jgi:tetratricopeptide (TPR) repeat protein